MTGRLTDFSSADQQWYRMKKNLYLFLYLNKKDKPLSCAFAIA